MGNTFEPLESRVTIEIDGVTVADSTGAIALHEGDLPVRYYLPKEDVRLDLLSETDSTSRCPWKGRARYWSAEINGGTHHDVAWGYEEPLDGAVEIAGRICFYNHRVDIRVE